MRFNDSVKALVERTGSEVTSPVVVITVGITEEVSTKNRVAIGNFIQGSVSSLVHSMEVVGQSSKLKLIQI